MATAYFTYQSELRDLIHLLKDAGVSPVTRLRQTRVKNVCVAAVVREESDPMVQIEPEREGAAQALCKNVRTQA